MSILSGEMVQIEIHNKMINVFLKEKLEIALLSDLENLECIETSDKSKYKRQPIEFIKTFSFNKSCLVVGYALLNKDLIEFGENSNERKKVVGFAIFKVGGDMIYFDRFKIFDLYSISYINNPIKIKPYKLVLPI